MWGRISMWGTPVGYAGVVRRCGVCMVGMHGACMGHAWGMHGVRRWGTPVWGVHGGACMGHAVCGMPPMHLGRILEIAAVRPAACLDAVVESAAEEAVQRPPITIRRTAADLIGVGEG